MFICRAVLILAVSTITAATTRAGTINTSAGAITVTDVITSVGSLFEYNYSVSDATGELAVLDIAVTPGTSISGLTAPGGSTAFKTAYDSVLGLVSFVENNALFTAAPESGFILLSPVAPGASTFDVTLFDGKTGVGSVTAPAVPEPASLTLCLLCGAAILIWRKKLVASRTI